VDFLTKKLVKVILFSQAEVFCGPQKYRKCVGDCGLLRTPLGELTALPQTPCRLGRGLRRK